MSRILPAAFKKQEIIKQQKTKTVMHRQISTKKNYWLRGVGGQTLHPLTVENQPPGSNFFQ